MLYTIDAVSKDISHCRGKTSLAALGWSEKDLENLIFRNIETLMGQDLMVLFQERDWKAEPDILAIDDHGNTWIFELKRWSAEEDAVLQLLRYGQVFGQHPYEKLERYYRMQKAKTLPSAKVSSLLHDHQKYFDLSAPLSETDFNRNHTLVVVSDGLAPECASAVEFWHVKGVDLRHFPVHAYSFGDGAPILEFPSGQPLGEGMWLLNTNRKSGLGDEREMIDGKKAAAYCDPWKYKILKLRKGDRVFFFANGDGIIATGLVETGRVQKAAYGGVTDDEYSVTLGEFKQPKTSIAAAMIRETILGHSLNYRQAMVSLSRNDGEAILKYF